MSILQQLQHIAQAEQEPELVSYVVKACQSRRAFCFSKGSDWLVVEPVALPTPHLLVVAAYCRSGNGIARYENDVFALARHINVNKIHFRSQRKGYQRVMPKRGWRLLADTQTWEFNLG